MTLLSEQFEESKRNNYDLNSPSVDIFEADTRANIDAQVSTAKRYPRNLKNVLENIYFLATQDKETADNCFYTIKRDGKTIRGASVRLAEIISNCYGNIRASSRIISNDGRVLTAQGICWDLENNVAYSIEVKRKITHKDGTPFSEDMQVVTANAVCSIAIRNAIFKCVPLGITNSVQERIKKVVLGSENDFTTIRKIAVEYFENQGVPTKTILSLFEKKTIDDLTREDVFDLRGIANAIKDGDTTLELAFSLSSKSNAIGKASRALSVPIDEDFPITIKSDIKAVKAVNTEYTDVTDKDLSKEGNKVVDMTLRGMAETKTDSKSDIDGGFHIEEEVNIVSEVKEEIIQDKKTETTKTKEKKKSPPTNEGIVNNDLFN